MSEMLETEYGVFTNNEVTGETAEEVYERFLKNKDKVIEPIKTNAELQAEVESLKSELSAITERLAMQQEISSTTMQYLYGGEALKND